MFRELVGSYDLHLLRERKVITSCIMSEILRLFRGYSV